MGGFANRHQILQLRGPWRSPGCHDHIGVGARRQFRRSWPENAPTRRRFPAKVQKLPIFASMNQFGS
ncbi:unnamed protein product [Cuscuta campestris]|uniref:Uncharacterized protein n=1 Tax=Cuscuta campestris TaxID=132261 RepID=A0A484N379_9ASTE|nr:unnamed protein product [Cuscuta campestris]